jgi:hypothetical protein
VLSVLLRGTGAAEIHRAGGEGGVRVIGYRLSAMSTQLSAFSCRFRRFAACGRGGFADC